MPPQSLPKLLLCAGATAGAASWKAVTKAEPAIVVNNITEVDGEQLYGVEYLLLDLHEGVDVFGSSCEGKPGSGWAPAAGETHKLACGW